MKTTHDMTPAERDACLANYDPDRDPDNMRGQLIDCVKAEQFMLAGNATVTVVSKRTGKRYTFKIAKPQDFDMTRPIWFVSVLKGEDNERDFGYMGQIKQRGPDYWYERGRKCWEQWFAASDAFAWLWETVTINPTRMDACELWHEGRCGRCGRKLTVPESIESGFGPECVNHV